MHPSFWLENLWRNESNTDQGAGGTAEFVHIRGEWSQDGLPASAAAPRPFDAAPWFGIEW